MPGYFLMPKHARYGRFLLFLLKSNIMYLKKLSLLNFKNIEQEEINPSTALNCFVGDNGTCKTNILDAIYFLSMCKSSLAMTDRQCIRHGSDFMMLDGEYESASGRPERILCSSKIGEPKIFKRNGKQYEKLSEHVGLIPVVLVSPIDTALVLDAAEERRRYLNAFISQLDQDYMHALIRYNQVLAQRNSCIKARCGSDMLDIFDQQMEHSAELIYSRRKEIIGRLSPIVEKFYSMLSFSREEVHLSYKSELEQMPFLELLRSTREKDFILGYTSGGIHRDDMVFRIGEMPLRKFGSQGQQKSFLIALKLAQYVIISESKGEKPILLLDDVFDKLDESRVQSLVNIVTGDDFGQIFITDCNADRMHRIFASVECPQRMFGVTYGKICDTESVK